MERLIEIIQAAGRPQVLLDDMHFIHQAKISDYNREPDLEIIIGT